MGVREKILFRTRPLFNYSTLWLLAPETTSISGNKIGIFALRQETVLPLTLQFVA
jgi:hypothetical protein